MPSTPHRLLAVLAVTLLASGCLGASQDTAGEAPAPTATPPTPAWDLTYMPAVTRPRAVGKSFVMYTLSPEKTLQLVALRPEDGAVLWKKPATWSGLTIGVHATLPVKDGLVFFVEPQPAAEAKYVVTKTQKPYPLARIVAVQADTGKVVWRTKKVWEFRDSPRFCDDGKTSLCLSAVPEADLKNWKAVLMKVDVKTGRSTVPKHQSTEGLSRSVGSNLYDSGARKPEQLIHVDDTGKETWRKPLGTLFPVKGASTSNGWTFEQVGDTYVGQVGLDNKTDVNDKTWPKYRDLSDTLTAGFEVKTGRPMWTDRGSEMFCASQFDDLTMSDDEDRHIRCRITGRFAWASKKALATYTPGLHVVVEAYDPLTGLTTWRADVGAANVNNLGDRRIVRLGPGRFALPQLTGDPVALDLATGAVGSPDAFKALVRRHQQVRLGGRRRRQDRTHR